MGFKRLLYLCTPPGLWMLGKRILKPDAIESFIDKELVGSYSQYSEDLIVDVLLGCSLDGCYIDIGANDPELLSNTHRFYMRGWRGINIEPEPNLFQKLSEGRPLDVNLNVGVGAEISILKFYRLEPSTLLSFDPAVARHNLRSIGAKALGEVILPVVTITSILDEHLNNRDIDFMSIDVEGSELEVLRGNDWQRYRPRLILIEINHRGKEIQSYLNTHGYRLIWSNSTNGIFIDEAMIKS